MIVLPEILNTDDLVVLGCLLFCMVVARMLKEEARIAAYALVAVVLTDNPSMLIVVPLLAMVIKNLRFI